MPKTNLTAEQLRELLHYDPETGIFVWRSKVSWGIKIGDIAGTIEKSGYKVITFKKSLYKAHRLAWLYIHDKWPKDQIDHANGIRNDNRLVNLREATRAENAQNAGSRKGRDKASRGTSYKEDCNKWQAEIQVSGCRKYLGIFDTQEEAHKAYVAAKLVHHTFSPVAYSQK